MAIHDVGRIERIQQALLGAAVKASARDAGLSSGQVLSRPVHGADCLRRVIEITTRSSSVVTPRDVCNRLHFSLSEENDRRSGVIITVHLAHHVSAEQETKVRELVERIGLLDSTWEKAQFRIDRDDFTWISGRADAAVDALLALVLDAIRSESSLAAVT